MPYIFASLVIAMLFGIGAQGVYGPETLLEPWVNTTFWWIIGTGIAIAAAREVVCVLCTKTKGRIQGLCVWKPCAQL